MKNPLLSVYILHFLLPAREESNVYISELKNGSNYPTAITLLGYDKGLISHSNSSCSRIPRALLFSKLAFSP